MGQMSDSVNAAPSASCLMLISSQLKLPPYSQVVERKPSPIGERTVQGIPKTVFYAVAGTAIALVLGLIGLSVYLMSLRKQLKATKEG